MNNEHPGRNMSKAEKDFWIEMSICEIWTQSHFAEIAFNNINTKAPTGTDPVFLPFTPSCRRLCKRIKTASKAQIKAPRNASEISVSVRFMSILDVSSLSHLLDFSQR